MSVWFALGYDGNLYNLCDCGDIEAAEDSAIDVTGSKALWLFAEDTARQWLEVLLKGVTMNRKLKLSAVEAPDDEEDGRLYVRLNSHADLCVKRTDEGYVVDIFRVPPYDGLLESVATTWVHDNDLHGDEYTDEAEEE